MAKASVLILLLVGFVAPVTASVPAVPLFFIAKSENRNQVHYAVAVDQQCHPVGKNPVYAYWREFEAGPRVVSWLLDREQSAYGVGESQTTVTPTGGRVVVKLRGFPDRPLIIDVAQQETGCVARAQTLINHQPAVLQSIYLDLGFLCISSATIRGTRVQDGALLQEQIHP